MFERKFVVEGLLLGTRSVEPLPFQERRGERVLAGERGDDGCGWCRFSKHDASGPNLTATHSFSPQGEDSKARREVPVINRPESWERAGNFPNETAGEQAEKENNKGQDGDGRLGKEVGSKRWNIGRGLIDKDNLQDKEVVIE